MGWNYAKKESIDCRCHAKKSSNGKLKVFGGDRARQTRIGASSFKAAFCAVFERLESFSSSDDGECLRRCTGRNFCLLAFHVSFANRYVSDCTGETAKANNENDPSRRSRKQLKRVENLQDVSDRLHVFFDGTAASVQRWNRKHLPSPHQITRSCLKFRTPINNSWRFQRLRWRFQFFRIEVFYF